MLMELKITRRAGMFTPAANVEVAAKIRIYMHRCIVCKQASKNTH